MFRQDCPSAGPSLPLVCLSLTRPPANFFLFDGRVVAQACTEQILTCCRGFKTRPPMARHHPSVTTEADRDSLRNHPSKTQGAFTRQLARCHLHYCVFSRLEVPIPNTELVGAVIAAQERQACSNRAPPLFVTQLGPRRSRGSRLFCRPLFHSPPVEPAHSCC